MTQVNRPTSPHLGIYKWQNTMVLSILHRMTGVALYVGALAMVAWLIIAAYYPAQYAEWHAYATSAIGRIMLMGWTLSFYYHLGNGIRHLFWDMGKGFTLPAAARSCWMVVIFTVGATLGTWSYVYHTAGQL
jgi:succinate dehydrogenase / fumarate reductase cytochrome b subunit